MGKEWKVMKREFVTDKAEEAKGNFFRGTMVTKTIAEGLTFEEAKKKSHETGGFVVLVVRADAEIEEVKDDTN